MSNTDHVHIRTLNEALAEAMAIAWLLADHEGSLDFDSEHLRNVGILLMRLLSEAATAAAEGCDLLADSPNEQQAH